MNVDRDFMDRVAKMHEQKSQAYNPDSELDIDDIKAEIDQALTDGGYNRVPGGTYRTVYRKGKDHVVKFAGRDQSMSENNSEVRNWNRTEGVKVKDPFGSSEYCNARDYLADILAYQRSRYTDWIVMEWVDDGENNITPETADKVEAVLSDAGIHIDEIYPANVGRKNGRPVIFDYGGT